MEQQSKHLLRKELIQLAHSICDETISAPERERLESLLQEYPELRPVYLDYLRVHAALIWRYRTGDAVPAYGIELSDAPMPVSQSKPQPLRFDWGPRLFGRWALAFALAACLLVAFLSITNHLRDSSHPNLVSSKVELTSGASATYIATLRDASSAVWSNDGKPINVGSRVEVGALRIGSGEAELVLDSGAKLLIGGPAELRLESPLSAFLKKGTVAAHMPRAAKGFELRTPTSILVDQGTEFGVVADESGATEVHVFRGQVDLKYQDLESGNGPQKTLEMVDRHARRIDKLNGVGEQIPYSKASFGNLALRVADPIEWKVSEGGNGHYYQLVVEDNPITWHEAARVAMNSHYRGMPGHLVSVTSRAEDEFVLHSFIEELPTRGIWMGLTDVLREGFFGWVTGEPFEYSNWASWPEQQPDNFQEASWHGGEDYGMYTRFPDKQPWAWNDLSVDSIHETVSAYLVEYEAPLDALRNRSISLDPIQWRKDQGGNGHYYRLVLAIEPTNWEAIRKRAEATEVLGVKGSLVALETGKERGFIVDNILRVCGIPEIMIGLSGSLQANDLQWSNGQPIGDLEVSVPHLPTDLVYGLFRWDAAKKWPDGWMIQALDINTLPSGWFGYLIEYPVEANIETY